MCEQWEQLPLSRYTTVVKDTVKICFLNYFFQVDNKTHFGSYNPTQWSSGSYDQFSPRVLEFRACSICQVCFVVGCQSVVHGWCWMVTYPKHPDGSDDCIRIFYVPFFTSLILFKEMRAVQLFKKDFMNTQLRPCTALLRMNMLLFKNHNALCQMLSLPYVPRIIGVQSGIMDPRVVNKCYIEKVIIDLGFGG